MWKIGRQKQTQLRVALNFYRRATFMASFFFVILRPFTPGNRPGINLSKEMIKVHKQQYQSEAFNIAALESKVGETITFNAIIQNVRTTKWGGFLTVRKLGKLIQVVFDGDTQITQDGEPRPGDALVAECAIEITGKVKASNIKSNLIYFKNVEITSNAITIISAPEAHMPLDVNKAGEETYKLDTKLDWRHVSLRNPKDIAIFKVMSEIVRLYSEFLRARDFTQIFSPKIVSAGAEGGANIFNFEYFGQQCFLAQSPQFYKQMSVAYFERVFEVAPVFRAEKHATSRHLNEYISLDLEMGFIKDHTDIMALKVGLLQHILHGLGESCAEEMKMFEVDLPKLPDEVPSFTVAEIHEIIKREYGVDNTQEDDLNNEDEKLIGEYVLKNYDSDFLFATHYPTRMRAFYSFMDPENNDYTLTFDLIFKGRELTSGGQRMHDHTKFIEKIKSMNMNPEAFNFYLDIFKYGMPPHGGFGMGLERLVMAFLGLSNIKEASLFPRDINRVIP